MYNFILCLIINYHRKRRNQYYVQNNNKIKNEDIDTFAFINAKELFKLKQ